jgi:hypothetical protein
VGSSPDKVGSLLTCTVFCTPRARLLEHGRAGGLAVTCDTLEKIYKVSCFVSAPAGWVKLLHLYMFEIIWTAPALKL